MVRCIKSLEHQYAGKFFVSADVSGILKMWQTDFKRPQLLQTISLQGSISYNCALENRSLLDPHTFLTVAIKDQKCYTFMLKP